MRTTRSSRRSRSSVEFSRIPGTKTARITTKSKMFQPLRKKASGRGQYGGHADRELHDEDPEADAVDHEQRVAPAVDDALIRLEPEDGRVDRDRRDHDRGEDRRVDDSRESVPFGHAPRILPRRRRSIRAGPRSYTAEDERRAAEPSGRVERLARRPLEHLGGVVRGVVRALPRAVEDMFTDRCTQYAAAIAYRVLFSLFPLTIALVSIFGLVLQDDELRQSVIDELIAFLPSPRRRRATSSGRSRRSRRRSRRSD